MTRSIPTATPVPEATRRDFLVAGAIAAAGLLRPSRGLAAAAQSANPFTLGVASGDPTPGGVVLWTRLAPDPLNDGGMPDQPVPVRWQLAHDPQMQRLARQGVAIAWPSLAHSIHVDVNGLDPDHCDSFRRCGARRQPPHPVLRWPVSRLRALHGKAISLHGGVPGRAVNPERGRRRVYARVFCHPGRAARSAARLNTGGAHGRTSTVAPLEGVCSIA